MIVAFTLYVMSGREIFRKRRELRAFRSPSPNFVEDPFTGYKTTEVSVISEPMSEGMPARPANIFDVFNTRRGHHEHSPSQKGYEQYTTTIHSPPPSTIINHIPHSASNSTVSVKRYRAAVEANTAAWRYTKVALLFFISLCITWVPSSANRIYDLAHPNDVSYTLNFIAAIVLPLMGFWNGVIYFVTTRAVCAEFFWSLVPMRVSRGRDRDSRVRRSLVEPSVVRRSRLDEWSPSESTRHITGDAKDEEAV